MSEKIIIVGNELYHYGTKGQKWGERRYQYEDGSLTPEGRRHYGYGEARKAAKDKLKSIKNNYKKIDNDAYKSFKKASDFHLKITKKQKQRDSQRWDEALSKINKSNKAKEEYKQAKKDYKKEIADINKNSVKDYNKQVEKAYEKSDKAYDEYEKAKDLYKLTGKTGITRIFNNMSGKSEAVKEYQKAMDKVNKLTEESDEAWDKATAMYQETGRNKVERIINNIKYSK